MYAYKYIHTHVCLQCLHVFLRFARDKKRIGRGYKQETRDTVLWHSFLSMSECVCVCVPELQCKHGYNPSPHSQPAIHHPTSSTRIVSWNRNAPCKYLHNIWKRFLKTHSHTHTQTCARRNTHTDDPQFLCSINIFV